MQLKSMSIQTMFMKNFGLICSLCKHASALQNRKDCLLFCMCRARFQDNFILCMYKKGICAQLFFFISVLFSSLCVVLVLKINKQFPNLFQKI